LSALGENSPVRSPLRQAGGQFEGSGIYLQGAVVAVEAAPGVYALGGASGNSGEAGDGIYAVPGPGPSDGMTYGMAGTFGRNVLVAGNLLKSVHSLSTTLPILNTSICTNRSSSLRI